MRGTEDHSEIVDAGRWPRVSADGQRRIAFDQRLVQKRSEKMRGTLGPLGIVARFTGKFATFPVCHQNANWHTGKSSLGAREQ
jgi:hypothetical protein